MHCSIIQMTLLRLSFLMAIAACAHPSVPATGPEAPAIPTARSSAPTSPPVEDWGWIVRDGGTFTVEREPLRAALDPTVSARPGYALPFRDAAGQVVGVRLHGATVGTPMYQLGFRSGDVVQRVNDFALTGPSTIYGAWEGLQQVSRAEVTFQRAGESVVYTYVLAPLP